MAQFHAIVEDIVEVDTECSKCHRGSTARVKSRGSGSAASFVGFDRAHAQDRALEVAQQEVVHQAKLTMSLVRCAHCHHRSRRELAWFIGLNAVGFLVVLAILAVARFLLAPWWGLALLALGAAAIPFHAYRRFNAAASLVLSVRPRALLPEAKVVSTSSPPAVKPAPNTRAPSPELAPSETRRLLR